MGTLYNSTRISLAAIRIGAVKRFFFAHRDSKMFDAMMSTVVEPTCATYVFFAI
jgi:hypothetical protein